MEKKYKVFYQGSLYGHFGRDRAGKEIAVNKSFTWGGEEWLVPSSPYLSSRASAASPLSGKSGFQQSELENSMSLFLPPN